MGHIVGIGARGGTGYVLVGRLYTIGDVGIKIRWSSKFCQIYFQIGWGRLVGRWARG